MSKSRRAAGFTLVEMTIVTAILAILASLAITNLIRSRIAANEVAAIGNLKTICSAQASYNIANKVYGTFADLTNDPLGVGVGVLVGSWNNGTARSGYLFSIEAATEADFVCYADPVVPGKTGIHYFRVDGSGFIRQSSTGRPSTTDEAIGTAAT